MKTISKQKTLILLLLILLIGGFIRVWKLDSIPWGFFCDEASIGYNSYTLATRGVDEFGTSWPLFFKAFGEYKSPIMIYTGIFFVKILGLSEFSIRSISAFYGILGIIAIYFLAKVLSNKNIGLFSALLLAISPWHIHFSRIAFEMMPFVFFTTMGLYFYIKYNTFRVHLLDLFLSIIFFNLAFYSYSPARIFIPLLILIKLKITLKHTFCPVCLEYF